MSIPSPKDVVEFLAGFGVTCNEKDSGCSTFISETGIRSIINKRVIPFINDKTRLNIGDALTEYVEYYDGNDKDILVLNRRPIVELKDITFVGGTNYPASISSIEVLKEEGMLKAKSNLSEGVERRFFTRGKRNIKLTYTAGILEVNERLGTAILLLTANFVLQQIANRTGGGNVQTQAFTRDFGPRGRWGIVRTEYVAEATDIIRDFGTGVVN